jgi:hypothetical protein
MVAHAAIAAVLPEDRADALYHYYDGGGVEISGPSLLVRKQVLENVSVYGNYYVDSITSASIDVQVLTAASTYEEERTETSFGVDYLVGDGILSFAIGSSEENDYTADTLNFGIAQEVFGGLTTVSMGYTRGSDVVGQNGAGNESFAEDVDRRKYRLGISQVLTKNLLTSLSYEAITDEGYLNNPYRAYRHLDPANPGIYLFKQEVYPRTRSSNAVALRGRYHMPYRAAIHGGYRFFTDTWGIEGHTLELGYTHPYRQAWTFDFGYRFYSQTQADFYSDLFPFEDSQNFLARDKELSTFVSHSLHFGVKYDFMEAGWGFLDKGTVNLFYNHILFDYDNFTDLSITYAPGSEPAPGNEPLYSFSADVIQFFVSFWF